MIPSTLAVRTGLFRKASPVTLTRSRLAASGILLIGAPVALACGAAAAQTPDAAEGAPEEKAIVVEAPRTLPAPPERSGSTGAPIVVTTTIQIGALYGDLDLSRPADAARLMTRIKRVATDACQYLDRLYPLSPDPDCIDRAITRAEPTAQAIIAAAQK